MRKLLLLFLPSLAFAQVQTQQLPQMPTVQTGDFFIDERIGSSFNPGLAPFSALQSAILSNGAIWNGTTLSVGVGGSGAQNLNGPLKGNGTSPFTTASATDIANLFSGVVSSACYLRGDGACFAPPGSGTVITTGAAATSGQPAAFSGPTSITPATAANITSLWSGSCSSSTYLRGDGSCQTPAGAGTVTSVDMTLPSWLTVTGNPITGAGVFAITATTGLAGNQVLATPAGTTGAVSPRVLVAGDIPQIPLSTGVTGTLPIGNTPIIPLATQVSGVLPAVNGGTGVNNGTNTLTISGSTATFDATQTHNIGAREVAAVVAGSPCLNINYTTVLSDSGRMLCNSSSSAVTFTIAANASVAYPIGTQLFFLNPCGKGTVTIAINSDAMFLIGSASLTGSRTLAACGAATAIKYGTTSWAIGGQLIS